LRNINSFFFGQIKFFSNLQIRNKQLSLNFWCKLLEIHLLFLSL
jgi:hypothetical protein